MNNLIKKISNYKFLAKYKYTTRNSGEDRDSNPPRFRPHCLLTQEKSPVVLIGISQSITKWTWSFIWYIQINGCCACSILAPNQNHMTWVSNCFFWGGDFGINHSKKQFYLINICKFDPIKKSLVIWFGPIY